MEDKKPAFTKIMIIDDTFEDRYIASTIIKLEKIAPEVLEFDTAEKAYDYLLKNKSDKAALPELILLDIRMPEIDGFAFLDMIKGIQHEINDSCKIILLSSSLDPIDHTKAALYSMVKGFLTKPLEVSQLEDLRKI
jgi:CheY-like chemotaxis protein